MGILNCTIYTLAAAILGLDLLFAWEFYWDIFRHFITYKLVKLLFWVFGLLTNSPYHLLLIIFIDI